VSIAPYQKDEESLFADVRRRYARKNQLLFGRDSTCLQDLLADIRHQKHRTLVLWAFDCAQDALNQLEACYYDDPRPREAVALCWQWAQGAIKMPLARRAILALHAMAKEVDNAVDAALCHALGHACATVHVETHAIGLPVYELTALVRNLGLGNSEQAVLDKAAHYRQRLAYWQEMIYQHPGPWAGFLMDDEAPNKERLLWEKDH